MKMEEEIKNLIGTTVEVITNGEVKEVTVEDVFTNKIGKCLVVDTDGNIYPEDDINWRYNLTLGACLMIWLNKFGYIDLEEALNENVSKYEAQLKDLFDLLIKQGYVVNNENEQQNS